MYRDLTIHPATRCNAVQSIAVDVSSAATLLALRYTVIGQIGDVCVPQRCEALRTDELWKHTCFEAFVRDAQGQAYFEFNFSPSSQWAAYRFDGYRSGMRSADGVEPPLIDVRSVDHSLRLQATVSLAGLVGLPRAGVWRLGLSAVIEEAGGRKSYWALAHPPGKPDFHHADCFALELPGT